MPEQLVTIAVVPRERFSMTRRSLESVLAHSDPKAPLIYVDGGSPPLVRQYLEQQAMRRGLHLISTERYVAPNVARNLAAALVRTRYVVFVDNDVVVSPGWIEQMVACAEATNAWVVGPVICEGEASDRIHSCGGAAEIAACGGTRELRFQRRYQGAALAEWQGALRREMVGMVEMHAVLVRAEVFDRLGPLDESLTSAAQHLDLCLSVQGAGGTIVVEPQAVVGYAPPPPFEPYDLPYFELRWSEAWNEASLAHFRRKWALSSDDSGTRALGEQLAAHRRLTFESYRRALRLLGSTPARWIEQLLIAPWETANNLRKYPRQSAAEQGQWRRAA